MPIETSVVVVVTNGIRVLVVHPTGRPWTRAWSLPKGLMDANETPIETACKEVLKETGLELYAPKLIDFGSYPYRAMKNMYFFGYKIDDDVEVASLVCKSTFKDTNGNIYPKVDRFAWIPRIKCAEYLDPAQFALYNEVVRWDAF